MKPMPLLEQFLITSCPVLPIPGKEMKATISNVVTLNNCTDLREIIKHSKIQVRIHMALSLGDICLSLSSALRVYLPWCQRQGVVCGMLWLAFELLITSF